MFGIFTGDLEETAAIFACDHKKDIIKKFSKIY